MSFKTYIINEMKKTEYKFSSTQINLPKELSEEIIDWGKKHISDDEIFAEDGLGREDEIHITVLYGLHDKKPDDVQKILENIKPFEISLGKISVFTNPLKYDVIKIEVESEKLHELNKNLQKLPHTNAYPTYKPHVTIAYVKKGKGWKKGGDKTFLGRHFEANSIIFSSRAGSKTKINLGD